MNESNINYYITWARYSNDNKNTINSKLSEIAQEYYNNLTTEYVNHSEGDQYSIH